MTLWGIDVSPYQAGIRMDQVRAEGFDFVIAKIGQGAGTPTRGEPRDASVSAEWIPQRDQAQAAGLLRCGYWLLGGDEPAPSQAARCKDAIGDPTIPMALSWTDGSGDWAAFTAAVAAFTSPRLGLNVRFAHTSQNYANTHAMPTTGVHDTNLLLWSSIITPTDPGYATVLFNEIYPSRTTPPWGGFGGAPATILQFTDCAQVAGTLTNANAYQGTRDQLNAVLTTPPSPAH